MYSVMWSEHCSYKSSKVHLNQFGEKVTDASAKHLMVGIGENAGVVDIGDGYAVMRASSSITVVSTVMRSVTDSVIRLRSSARCG